jgi:hypothetical protein
MLLLLVIWLVVVGTVGGTWVEVVLLLPMVAVP